MRLQLDSSGVQGAHSSYTAEVTSGTSNRSASSSGGAHPDSVGLSGTSRALQTGAALHSEKLNRISQAVRAGTYSVSSASVGRAIVAQSAAGSTSTGGRP